MKSQLNGVFMKWVQDSSISLGKQRCSGLEMTDKWNKDFNDTMKNQILEKNRQYKSGDLGTNCN